MASDLIFVGQFVASKVGKTGLTVTVDVDRYTISDGSRSSLVTGGSATEGRRGLYHYRLASADLSLYQYVATFITADTSVDQQEIAAIGLVVPDALVSSRLAPAIVGRVLEVDASGVASANVTSSTGVALTGRLAQVSDLPAAAPTAAQVRAEIDANSTQLAAILEDTGTTLPALVSGLDGAVVEVVSSVSGGTITVYAADTWRFTVSSDALVLAGYEVLALAVKRSARQADAEALLYLRSDTGLARMLGDDPISAANGSLTTTSTTFTGLVALAETLAAPAGQYLWWLKGFDTSATPDEATTLASGDFVVEAAGLQAVV